MFRVMIGDRIELVCDNSSEISTVLDILSERGITELGGSRQPRAAKAPKAPKALNGHGLPKLPETALEVPGRRGPKKLNNSQKAARRKSREIHAIMEATGKSYVEAQAIRTQNRLARADVGKKAKAK